MCSENVTSVPHFTFASGLACYPTDISEAHIEYGKLLQLGVVSCGGGVPVVLPVFSLPQFLKGLSGEDGDCGIQGGCPTNRSVVGGIVKQRQPFGLDVSIPGQKSAKSARTCVHRASRKSIDILPDELLCHIFHFLGTARDKLACASVSKRWLMLQSHMPRGSFVEDNARSCVTYLKAQDERDDGEVDDDEGNEGEVQPGHGGHLTRCLSGRKASDVRLAAIALGTETFGGLGKLCIKGGAATGGGVSLLTDVGLSAIGSWCAGLRVLVLWNCPYIKDEGLSALGNGCPLLEKVDLFKCPLVGDSGLQAIAKGCPQLSFLKLDECEKVGDKSLVAVAEHCANLTSLTIQNCLQISDYGITRAVCSLRRLKRLKLAGLKLTDKSLTSIGTQAGELLWLTLQNLDLVTADGFMFSGKAAGIQALKYLHISNCRNFTDLALVMVGNCCGSLQHFSLHKCDQISDMGLTLFMRNALWLQVLHLEKCNLITGTGLIAALSLRGKELREFQVRKCERISQVQVVCPPCIPIGSVLESICIADCPGVDDLLVALVGLLCQEAASIDFSGLTDITDDGLLAFLCGSRKLSTLKLSGCVKVTDRSVCAIVQQCGQTIRNLVLDGCKSLSDKTLKAISSHCPFLEDLDISDCAISNVGLEALTCSTGKVLTSLNLSGCGDITDKILPFIYKKCDSLQDLNLKNCRGLSERAIYAFQSRMWNCTVLY